MDIDGVLNSSKSGEQFGTFEILDPRCVALLRVVVERHRASIVVSSVKRLGRNWRETIAGLLSIAGWDDPPIVDRTPRMHIDSTRGEEIQAWLDHNNVDGFVIVDDDRDMLPSQMHAFVRCDFAVGLTEEEAIKIDNILQKSSTRKG